MLVLGAGEPAERRARLGCAQGSPRELPRLVAVPGGDDDDDGEGFRFRKWEYMLEVTKDPACFPDCCSCCCCFCWSMRFFHSVIEAVGGAVASASER